MKRVWLLGLLVACKSSGDGDDFPIHPNGGGTSGEQLDATTPIDAFDPDAGTQLTGRVCVVSDLRVLTACAATGAGNITVTLGTRSATTMDDGRFTIATPSGSNLVWRASGAAIVSSVVAFGPVHAIPAIGVEDFNDLMNANSVVLQADEGSIVARIVKAGMPQSGATAATIPAAQFPTKYDGPTATAWTELSTAAAGTAWVPGVPIGATTITATPASGTGASVDVRVEDQAITYVTIDLP
jgi:hypothetical protein